MHRAAAKHRQPPVLVAVVGGSGAGKSWLANKLQQAFSGVAARLSVDDFYLDRSHLSPGRRALINYDHPRAIDWAAFRGAVENLMQGRKGRVPAYDFATHCRLRKFRALTPTPLVIIDGLWLLHRSWLRNVFQFSVFLDAPAPLRLRRRLERDQAWRGRSSRSIRDQFWKTVEPMHRAHVQPQAKWASVVLKNTCHTRELAKLLASIRPLLLKAR